MKKKLIIAAMTLSVGIHATAQYSDSSTSRAYSNSAIEKNSIQRGFAGYVTAGAGYTGYNSNLNVEGAPTSLKLLGSYVSENNTGVYDVGYGIQNQTFSQDSASDSAISTGVFEAAARYQFENKWQAGAVYNQFFNKGSSYSANQADAEFGGIQVLRAFSFDENYLGRAGGRVMTSLNIDNETVTMGVLEFQMGWGGSLRKSSSAANF